MVDYSSLKKGMTLQAESGGVFYAAEVTAVKSNGNAPVKVKFLGYEGCDEWVGADRLRSKALKEKAEKKAESKALPKIYDYSGLEKGMRVHAESNGTYYAAEVVALKGKGKSPVKVKFVGYEGYDEWVGGDRLHSKALKVTKVETKPEGKANAKVKAKANTEKNEEKFDRMKRAAQLADDRLEWEWSMMPNRIIFIRHGESEANVEGREKVLASKGDNKVFLTERGLEQARYAGKHIAKIIGTDHFMVLLSPFERTQQTWMEIFKALDAKKLTCVHVEPRIREKEFGNLQPILSKEEQDKKRDDESKTGRFWWRAPNGESNADVFDRVCSCWEDIMRPGYYAPTLRFEHSEFSVHPHMRHVKDVNALMVVTHGLTFRLMLMRYFSWSVDTFDSVHNPGNCEFIILKKRTDGVRGWDICAEECSPDFQKGISSPLWSTRKIAIKMKSKSEYEKYTVVDWASVPPPRTQRINLKYVLERLVEGHPNLAPHPKYNDNQPWTKVSILPAMNEEDVEEINYWIDQGIDEKSKAFELRLDQHRKLANSK